MAPIDITAAPWNCVADSNCQPGHGTDNTLGLEAAISLASATGRKIYIPVGLEFEGGGVGSYRTTRPIRFNWTAGKVDFVGESQLQTAFFADFTSLVPCAAFMVDNPVGLRSYVGFENFSIFARSPELVSGIYCSWTGSFSHIDRVLVEGCNHGFVIANDFAIKVRDCTAISNLGNGIRFGWNIDDTSGPCNNIAVEGGIYTGNGNCGINVTECRSLNIDGAAAEANGIHNIYLNKVYCGSVSPVYMEFDPELPYIPQSQLYITNSEVVDVLASVSAFDLSNNPIVWLAGNNKSINIDLSAESSAVGPLNATAIRVEDSKGVKVRGSIKRILRGITIDATSEVEIDGVVFTDVAVPVWAADSASCVLSWRMAKRADVDASGIGASTKRDIQVVGAAPAPVALATSDFQSFTIEVRASDLNGSSGYSKILVPSALSGGQWRIVEILGVNITPFAGGDRGIAIADSTHIWSIIPNSALSAGTFQARWGSSQIPFSSTLSDMTQVTALGSNLVACATGGTCYHTSGFIKITVVAHREP